MYYNDVHSKHLRWVDITWDPKSRIGASRFIGYSPSAGRVLTVIAYRDLDGDVHGVNAWPATGADLKLYEEETENG